MNRAGRFVVAAMLSACHCAVALADDDTPLQRLADNARSWEARGRPDQAAEVWSQLLRLAPNDARALSALCRYHALRDEHDAARELLDRLRTHSPDDPDIAALERVVALGSAFPRQLDEARKLAAAGHTEESVASYRALSGGGHFDDRLELEFLQTVAGTRSGLDEARAGLSVLAARHKDLPDYELALARALTYAESTRRDGIKRLEALAAIRCAPAKKVDSPTQTRAKPNNAATATDETCQRALDAESSQRSALLWLAAADSDKPLYEHFLKTHRDDPDIAAKLAAIGLKNSAHSDENQLREAFDSLSANDPVAAARTFARFLDSHPHDARALAGLASVRLKQQRFVEARDLARAAKAHAPGRAASWDGVLRVAEFWTAIRDAEESVRRADLAGAEATLKRAMGDSPYDAPRALPILGRIYLKTGRYSEAEEALRKAVEWARDRPAADLPLDAVRGWIVALLRQGRSDRADVAEAWLHVPGHVAATRSTEVDEAVLRGRAEAEIDDSRAAALLEKALAMAPHDRAARLELLYRKLGAGDVKAARSLTTDLLAETPDDAEVLAAAALVDDAQGDPASASVKLRKLDEAGLSPSLRALQRRVTLQLRCDEARKQGGGSGAVRERLSTLDRSAGDNADERLIVAAALVKAELREEARVIARDVLARKADCDGRLRAAGLLLDGNVVEDEAAIERSLVELSNDRGLNARSQAGVRSLSIGLAVRQADRLREAGKIEAAFARIRPFLVADGNDSAVLGLLARLYAAAGDDARSREIYRRLMDAHPDDLDVLTAAALNDWSAGRDHSAGELADQALSRFPGRPSAWLLAGRIAAGTGDDAKAWRLLHRGLELVHADDERNATAKHDPLLDDAVLRFDSANPANPDNPDHPGDGAERSTALALAKEAAVVDKRVAIEFGGTALFRFRTGDVGLGRVVEVSAPVEFSFSPARHGRLSFAVTPIYMSAGTLELDSPSVAPLFGTHARDPLNPVLSNPLKNERGGISLALRYQYRGLDAQVGSTPLGFLVADVVGGIGWNGRFGPLRVGVRAFRLAVMDSMLSYGGRRDDLSGTVWGGVRRAGGQVDLGYDNNAAQVHAYAMYASLNGEHVAANSGGQYGFEAFWRFLRRSPDELAAGLQFLAMSNQLNLRFFSFGQGGYFSPQVYLAGGVPIRWKRVTRTMSIEAGGMIGVAWYREDPSPVFPLDSSLLVPHALSSSDGSTIVNGNFPGSDHLGACGWLHLEVTNELGAHVRLAESLLGNFANAYSEVLGSISVRGTF